jgi:hypothetical protein
MTAITTARRGGSRFAPAARMEWIKLRSLRGTGWALAAAAAAVIAIAVVVGLREPAHPTAAQLARYDPTETGFAGLALAQVAAGVLGVLVMTGEYSSGPWSRCCSRCRWCWPRCPPRCPARPSGSCR